VGAVSPTGWMRLAIRRPESSSWLIHSWTLTPSLLLHRKAFGPDAGLVKQLRRRETNAAEAAQLPEIAAGGPAGSWNAGSRVAPPISRRAIGTIARPARGAWPKLAPPPGQPATAIGGE